MSPFLESKYIPFIFVAVVLFLRYLFKDTIDFIVGMIDFVRNTIALALDATDLVAYPFRTEYTNSPWSIIIFTTPSILHLLSLVGFGASLRYLSASQPHKPPTRQSLQDLLDEAEQDFRVLEGTLRNWQSFGEDLHASNKKLQMQNKRLQVEKEQAIAGKDSTRKELAESAETIENLTTDLEVAKSVNRRLEKSRFTAAFSLKAATDKADRLEEARKAADDEVLKLTEELVKANRWAATASTKTEQSHKTPDHTDCIRKAAVLNNQVESLQKALKTPQHDQKDRVRKQAAMIRALRERLVEQEGRQQALKKQIKSFKVTKDDRQIEIRQLKDSLTTYASLLERAQAAFVDLEKSKAAKTASSQQEADTLGLKESLAAKDSCLQQAQADILHLKESLAAKDSCSQQAQAYILDLNESLAAKDASLQKAQAHILDLKESLAAKDSLFQQAQADVQGLKESLAAQDTSLQQANAGNLLDEQVDALINEEKYQALNKEVESLKVEINDRQVKINQVEESLADRDASLQQAQADIMDLTEKVEELTAAKGEVADPESEKLENQRHEIERLNGEVFALKAAHDSREVELLDASAGAMTVDHAIVKSQPQEIADLQEKVEQLQAALDQAQVDLSAGRHEGDEMDLEDHECDHSRCRQRELEQDVHLAKLHGTSLAQEKQISALARQVQEQELQMQNLRATVQGSPSVTTAAGSESLSLEVSRLRKEKADLLVRAKRDHKKVVDKLEDRHRAKEMEVKELAAQLQREKVAAQTRVENTIREMLSAAKRGLEEMRVDRDRCRANNSALLARATEAEKALAECQRQREELMMDAD